MSFRNCSIALLFGVVSLASQATQQCFNYAGTYGAVNITVSAGCATLGLYNTRDGYLLGDAENCTISFNKPIVTSSVTIDMDHFNTNEITTVSTSAGAYTVLGGDLTGPLVPGDVNSLSASGGNIVSTVGIASGRFTFTSSPPASITSLTLTRGGIGDVVLYRVCADDAGIAPPPTPVPTLSEWAMITFAMLIAGFGIYEQRRRQS